MRANCRSIPKDFHFPIFGPGQFELDFAAHFDLRLQGLSQWNAEPVLFGRKKKTRGFGKGKASSRRLRRDGAFAGFFIVAAENTFHCLAPLHSPARPAARARGSILHQTAKSRRLHLSELTVKGNLRQKAAQQRQESRRKSGGIGRSSLSGSGRLPLPAWCWRIW